MRNSGCVLKPVLIATALLAGSCSASRDTPVTATPEAVELARRVATLELRRTRIEDVNAIKRLQRAYGYYIDEGQWDDVADLFAADASIEVGFDGVYRGRERIREYLHAMGNGRNGLARGQLNEHFQLMPVVTVGDDGRSARGTWRDVMLTGQRDKEAHWGEGPFENEYVKENGVWKIRNLHWFQTLYVPYDGGWAKHPDSNGGRFAGSRLTPDAPTSVTYKTWPGAFTPPFHFRSQYPGFKPVAAPVQVTPLSARDLATRLQALTRDIQRLADHDAVETLQRIYGFYIDKGQWSDAAALFSDDAEFIIQGKGVFRGPAGVLRYLRAVGPEGLQSGRLYEHMQLQPIVHVAADGRSAKGRWHLFAQLALAGRFHEWATGVYENEYANEGGVWKISRMHLYPTMITPYDDGWSKTSLPASRFEPAIAADAPHRGPTSLYDESFVAPFHYAHPVRGVTTRTTRNSAATPVQNTPAQVSLDSLERQIGLIEDRTQIENLQMVYGYYLATLLWDDLAALFADDGTIEIALRGVYAGRPAVRRNLNLYGQAGLDDGVLHNHMQYQPVIHVAPDGRTAKLRSRALSMMGNYERSGMWMGGVYENTFEKIDGRWMFKTDQVMNTYFAPYETGWKDLAQRPPPGVTASNPPDRPPTFQFDMYPKNFLPPYHYVNPVTGAQHAPPAR